MFPLLCKSFAALLYLFLRFSDAATNATINSQLRLAYAGATGMYVSWNTFERLERPTIHYGLTPTELNMTATSNISITYHTSLTYNNHVKIMNLKPDTIYYYLPEHLLHMDSTHAYNFTTSRAAGVEHEFSVAVVVDMGTMGSQGLTTTAGQGVSPNNTLKPNEINTVQSLERYRDSYDFVWHRKTSSDLCLQFR